MGKKLDNFEEKLDEKIDSLAPTGKNKLMTNLWLGACAATMATGFYTYVIDWNPVVRVGAHLAGAFAIPAAGALASSLAIHGIEGAVNLGINHYNKKHPEKQKEKFKIPENIQNFLKVVSTASVGIFYSVGTLQYEADQFAVSGIAQYGQYISDAVGSIAGIAAFNKLDAIETGASFMQKVRALSKAIVKPVNAVEDKVKESVKWEKEPLKESGLSVEEINVIPQSQIVKEETPAWDLSLYKNETPENSSTKKTQDISQVNESKKTSNEEEINI